MAVIAECQCGRRFRASNELRGRRVKCPGCGQVLTISATDPDALESVAAGIPEVANIPAPDPPPKRAPAAPRNVPANTAAFGYPVRRPVKPGSNQTPKFAVSPKTILFLVLLVVIPTVIYLIKIGPVSAMARWQHDMPLINGDIQDVHIRFLNGYFEKIGVDMSKPSSTPKITGLALDDPPMFIRFPKEIPYNGLCTRGQFRGVYYTDTSRMKGTITIDEVEMPIDATDIDGKITFNP